MSAGRPFRLLAVYEYAGQADHMMASLLAHLSAEMPGLRIGRVAGLFPAYRPGGLRPRRLLNLAWVYVAVWIRLLGPRPTAILVHSAPPGVQLWTVFWASLRRIPVYFWLMDCHPELEARLLERRGWRVLAKALRRLDRHLMPRFEAIITLDEAMANLARDRAPAVEICEHPTWGVPTAPAGTPLTAPLPAGDEPLRLAYSGNLGVAHDLSMLRRLLAEVVRTRPVALVVIGASPEGEARFLRFGAGLGLEVKVLPRVPFSDLPAIYREHRLHAGLVLLAEESAGLVSPSKFSGYINFGVPLVYVGPPATNTALVCTRFAGGFWLPNSASEADVSRVAARMQDAAELAAAGTGARAAAEFFSGFGGRSMARMLAPRLARAAERAEGR